MATTTYSTLRYPLSTAAPNVNQDIQNLASDLDQKVIVPVANPTARNALSAKYDGMVCYTISEKRYYRWDAGASAWKFMLGDTGWSTMALNSPLVQGSTVSQSRVHNNVQWVKVDASYSGAWGSGFTVNATALSAPVTDLYFLGQYYGGAVASLKVTSTGFVTIANGVGSATGLLAVLSWPI